MNKIIIIGRIGKDLETKTFEGGKSVVQFTVATSERYTTKEGEKKENTDWHNVVFWGRQAEILQHFCKKGDQIMIEGKMSYRSYEKDGVTKYISEIVGRSFEFLTSKNTSEQSIPKPPSAEDKAPQPQIESNAPDDQGLPF